MPQEDKQLVLACNQHGQMPWFMIELDGDQRFYCVACLREVLTRLGVCSMFPVVQPVAVEPVEQWPDELEVK